MAVHASDRPDWLDEALASLAGQTRPADRVVVVEDGPPGAALDAVLSRHAHTLPIERVARARAGGLGAALATGLAACRAPLVARMDADDRCAPERFDTQCACFAGDPSLAVLGSAATLLSPDGESVGLRRKPEAPERVAALVWTNPFVHSSVMFRADAIRAVGGYDPALKTRQDYDLWFRCVEAGLRLRNLPEALVSYRVAARGKDRDLGVVWRQAVTGWRGCRRVRAPLHAWLGVASPILLALLPASFGRWVRERLKASA